MRTTELINLLRSHDRTSPSTKAHLATLDSARRLHLLGELSNWLLVELQKYHDRQTGPTAIETSQQGSIRSQIRHTLLAIQVLLDTSNSSNGPNNNHGSSAGSRGFRAGNGAHSSEAAASSSVDPNASTLKPAAPLDDKQKEKILERFLKPILVGIAPLGPRVDSSDIQLLCAKILCYCANPFYAKDALFPSETLVRKMMTVFTSPSSLSSPSYPIQEVQQPTRLDKDRSRAPLKADAVAGMTSLLRSPMVKLQDYGLRILTYHRFLIQLDSTWDLLAPLNLILEQLKDNLNGITADQELELLDADRELVEQIEQGDGAARRDAEDGRGLGKEIVASIAIQSKALTVLQWFLQEAGKNVSARPRSSPIIQEQTSRSNGNTTGSSTSSFPHRNLEKLKAAANVELLVDLWKAVQYIVLFFDKSKFPAGERLVMVISASIYWVCWIFQDDAMLYVMTSGADTLMAWYGYYIIPRDHPSTSSTSPSGLASHPPAAASSSPPSSSSPPRVDNDLQHHDANLIQQSIILEYLSKLIQNIVTPKKHHLALFAGSVGIIIMRRTIEFLEGILESALPLVDLEPEVGKARSLYTSDDDATPTTSKGASYSIRVIQARPGVLEAMSGIVAGCINGSKEGTSLVMNSRLLNVFLLLLSDLANLFDIRHLQESTARKIRDLSLSALQRILNRDEPVPGVEDIPLTHWTMGYTPLVELIMGPLEKEAGEAMSGSIQHRNSNRTSEYEMEVEALRVFALFWKHYSKGRYILSDLLGPRLHQLRMVPLLLDPTEIVASDKVRDWRRPRTLLLMESTVYFGHESSVRINMRESWSSLPFLVALLGASVKRLEANGYHPRDTMSRMVMERCFLALRNFWYDRIGLVQLIELNLAAEGSGGDLWDALMPSAVISESRAGSTSTSVSSSASIVPILVAIIAPPGTEWSSELMLDSGMLREREGWRPQGHPLFERQESLLVESTLMLAQLSQFMECQQRLISKPGVMWILSRMMVERSLVGHLNTSKKETSSLDVSEDGESPQELFEKALFELLTRIMSAVDLAKSLVSNNTITEVFAAMLEIDKPLYFYKTKMGFVDLPTGRTNIVTGDTVQAETVSSDELPAAEIPGDQILPTPRQHYLHQQLLQHFRTTMAPLRIQFERIFHYIGGHRSLQDADETAESIYWLREYCALVFLYALEPPSPTSSTSWGVKIDKTALLNSESVFGVVCRMLTLEMEYDSVDAENAEEKDGVVESITLDKTDMVSAQREEALLRRFSAGVAIQSLSWKHMYQWRQQHQDLIRSYESVLTTEWEAHVATLKGNGISSDIAPATPISFMVRDRVITFPDRLLLSGASSYFHTLLLGDFKEASQQHILIQDVDPDGFETLMEVVKESQLTASLLLPEDLPFALVLRLMVCANRFLVTFVKRLAEAWILQALRTREMKYYELKQKPQAAGDDPLGTDETTKRHRDHSPDLLPEKRQKLEDASKLSASSPVVDSATHRDQEDDDEEEPIQECLLMVYEACSDPHHGSLYSPGHPFYGLIWDVLKRMIVRLGSVAITPRFAAILNAGGEESIQEFLQIVYELAVNGEPP
ncbi:hypothetical protein BGZ58_006192 [Dissophora ornata]|nr:hypothetical protein BGZ58_006192 [Dissophora ornata]